MNNLSPHLQLCHVWCELIQIGQLHVIAIDMTEVGIGIASFTALAGLNLVEDYLEATRKAIEDKEDYVEAEVVK